MKTRVAAELACFLEATARKPGNAHRDRDLPNLRYLQLIAAGAAVGPILEQAAHRGVGQTILDAAIATREICGTNANLGILLLLAPMAALAEQNQPLEQIHEVLASLGIEEAAKVYEAIRIADAGGLGKADTQDVRQPPTVTIVEAMTLAADRDRIACQYANGFEEIRSFGLPILSGALAEGVRLEDAIVWCHLHWMARYPDSLIARKRGPAEAAESARKAAAVLDQVPGPQGIADAITRVGPLQELDLWLTSAGQGRNPGTTADLVTACLFWGLKLDRIDVDTQSF